MSGDGSILYRSQDTRYSPSYHRIYDGISDDESLKCLRLMEDVGIGLLIPSTLPLVIMNFIIFVTMVEVGIDIKRLATLPHTIVEFIMVVIKMVTLVKVYIGLNIL